jgi:hypothetical protein
MGTVTCCANTTLCLRKPEVFTLSVKLQAPPFSSEDKCAVGRTGQTMALSKQWTIEGQMSSDCLTGYTANGLKGDRTIKVCGGNGECLSVGSTINIGGARYKVVNAAIAPITADKSCKTTANSVVNTPSGCKSCGSGGAAGATTVCTCANKSVSQCQILLLDRALEDDYLNVMAIVDASEQSFQGDNLGDGTFRVRVSSAKLGSGNAGVLSLFLVQRRKRKSFERIYTGVSFPVVVN